MTAAAPSDTRGGRIGPTLLDRLDLALLRLAKRNRARLDAPDFYEEFFAGDEAKYVDDVRARWRYGIVRRAWEEAGRPLDVLDVGCGLAAVRRWLPDDITYVGVDVSAASLERARRAGDADLRLGGFPTLPIDDGAADFALCLEVLEHVEDDAAAVRELGRVVRPGGHVLVSVPRTFYWAEYRNLIGHYRHYSPQSLAAVMRLGGFAPTAAYPQYPRLWHAYHYGYVLVAGLAALARRLGYRPSIYSSRPYRALSRALLAVTARSSTSSDPTSTIVLFRRSEG